MSHIMKLEMSREVAEDLSQIAMDEGATEVEILRRGLSVLKAFKQQREQGRNHLGFVSDATRLEAEIVGILNH